MPIDVAGDGWPTSATSRSRRRHVVVRRPGEPEVYGCTSDLHERFAPGNPDWGDPPLEEEVRGTEQGWGAVDGPAGLFGPTVVRWYPTVQWFDGAGFADLLRSTSVYRSLDHDVREPPGSACPDLLRPDPTGTARCARVRDREQDWARGANEVRTGGHRLLGR
jgi:hypothetical protein